MSRFLVINSTVVGLLLTALCMSAFYFDSQIIQRIDLLASDMRFLVRGIEKPGPEVVIAAIDEKSIDQLGRWPWPFTVQAKLVRQLTRYRARVIAYDVVFSSSDTSAGINNLHAIKARMIAGGADPNPEVLAFLDRAIAEADHDRIFAKALKKSRRTILGYFFHYTRESIRHLSEKQMAEYLQYIRNSKYNAIKKAPNTRLKDIALTRAEAVESNIPILAKAARGGGYFSLTPDIDGAVRRYPLITKYRDLVEVPGEQDYLFAPLAIRTLERFLKGITIFQIDQLGVEKVGISGRRKIWIPTNGKGEMLINYRGPWGILDDKGHTQPLFPTYSIVDIIKGRKKFAPPKAFRRKMVLIGSTALALADLRVTPFDKAIPGVAIHANVIDNVLRKNFLQKPWWSGLFTGGLILFLGLAGALILPRLGALGGGIGSFVFLIGSVALNQYLFVRYGLWLSLAYPVLTVTVLYGGMTLYHYIVEEQEKRFIQGAFGTYLSPAVVAELVENPDLLALGGKRKEITAFFSDVAGFTSVSESMSPEALVSLLNEYLSDMADIILEHDGTLDKYEGDAIIAFFGAPHPMPDHPLQGCLVCLEMQERMVVLRAQWRERGMKELYMRIGLNTGQAVVGNMGSRTRMDYTMMGDTVNTAARFEGANKQYGSSIMIGQQTFEDAKEAIEVRELDLINVVGKVEPVPIYELLARKGELDETKTKVVDLYRKGLAVYKAMQFEEGKALFVEALSLDEDDGPSKTMRGRCELYMENPPPEGWNGAFVMTSK
ncbi:MAG: adenylate/guanylate cyclase domain-containing protein [bacterium]